MASSLSKSSAFVIAFICLALLFSDEHIVNAGRCEVPSGSYHGPCIQEIDGKSCAIKCKEYEDAIDGRCAMLRCLCIVMLPNTCDGPSGNFHGACFDDYGCDRTCKNSEGAVGGVCTDFKCVCRHNCQD